MKKKIQGLYEYINLYNQKQTDKSKRIPKLKILYKQILSDRENTSFSMEKFEDSQDVLGAINSFYHHNLIGFQPDDKPDSENILDKILGLLVNIKEYDTSKIFIKSRLLLKAFLQKV